MFSLFSFGIVFVSFYSGFTVFEKLIAGKYNLQVLLLLTSGTSFKVGLIAGDASM